MIPKIIHYCWFGRNPLPASAQKCIASWRKFLPDYEIWQWSEEPLNENEDEDENRLFDKIQVFDVNIIPYTKEAYEAKKYAFVSDYARFWILYKYGGLYFDTDVEVIKSMDDIIEKGSFMGLEDDGKKDLSKIAINPGLGLGAEVGLKIYQEILSTFGEMSFFDKDKKINGFTMIPMVTQKFTKLGLNNSGEIQCLEGIYVYPQRYFNPFDSIKGSLNLEPDTVCIHWYSASWMSPLSRLKKRVKYLIYKLFV